MSLCISYDISLVLLLLFVALFCHMLVHLFFLLLLYFMIFDVCILMREILVGGEVERIWGEWEEKIYCMKSSNIQLKKK